MTKPCAAALGFFDGVHTAHLRVLQNAAQYAAAHDMEPAAVTFDRSPKAFVTGADAPLICTAQERARIMREEAGISRVIVLPFDAAMRDMDARAFVENVVLGTLGAGYCAAGYDYRFGARGAGDAALLRQLCAAHGIPCGIVGCLQEDGEKISSTRIRERIAAGDMETAEALLGRPFSLSGEVIHGKALGRTLGFPTMNLPVPPELVLPAAGVYVCRVLVAGEWRRAVCNVAHGGKPLCEVHAFGYGGDAYGRQIRVELLHFVRGMRRFDSPEALARQVDFDKKVALDWFSSR